MTHTLWKRIKCFIEGHEYCLAEDRVGVFADGKYRKVIGSWCRKCSKWQHASIEVSEMDCK